MHLFEVHVFCGFCAGRVRAAAPGPRRDGPRVRETDPARPTGTAGQTLGRRESGRDGAERERETRRRSRAGRQSQREIYHEIYTRYTPRGVFRF